MLNANIKENTFTELEYKKEPNNKTLFIVLLIFLLFCICIALSVKHFLNIDDNNKLDKIKDNNISVVQDKNVQDNHAKELATNAEPVNNNDINDYIVNNYISNETTENESAENEEIIIYDDKNIESNNQQITINKPTKLKFNMNKKAFNSSAYNYSYNEYKTEDDNFIYSEVFNDGSSIGYQKRSDDKLYFGIDFSKDKDNKSIKVLCTATVKF